VVVDLGHLLLPAELVEEHPSLGNWDWITRRKTWLVQRTRSVAHLRRNLSRCRT
jgi:hypothetical protein